MRNLIAMPEWIVLISIGVGGALFLFLPTLARRWTFSSTEYLLVTTGAGFLLVGYPLLVAGTHIQTWVHHFQSCGGGVFPCNVSGAIAQIQFLFPILWTGALSAIALRTLSTWIQRHRNLQDLLQALDQKLVGNARARILPWPEPFLGLIGVWRPQLVISEGALQILSREELQAAILHEEAHRQLRHNVKDLALRIMIAGLPYRLRQKLYEGYVYLREVEADQQVPTPTALASALLKASTVTSPLEYSLALHSHSSILRSRLEYLLGVTSPPSPWSLRSIVGRFALLFVFLTVPLFGLYHLHEDSLMVSSPAPEVCPAVVTTCCPSSTS